MTDVTVTNITAGKRKGDKDWLKPTYEVAQQLLLQALLASMTKDVELAMHVMDRGVKAGILEIDEEDIGDGQTKAKLRIKEMQ